MPNMPGIAPNQSQMMMPPGSQVPPQMPMMQQPVPIQHSQPQQPMPGHQTITSDAGMMPPQPNYQQPHMVQQPQVAPQIPQAQSNPVVAQQPQQAPVAPAEPEKPKEVETAELISFD